MRLRVKNILLRYLNKMFDFSDSRFFGIIGILLILVIGYFVFLMYNDLVVLKKQVTDLNVEDFSGDYNSMDGEESEQEEDWQEDNHVDNEELDRHLNTIMEEVSIEDDLESDKNEVTISEMIESHNASPNQEEKVNTTKKRGRKPKAKDVNVTVNEELLDN